jgi:ribosomal protein S18 acetylase RimI-like enzyme
MPEPKGVTVSRLFPQDWQAYRAIRLAMLQESPRSFGGTHAGAASFDEQLWQERLAESVVLLASVDQIPAGLATYSDHDMADQGDSALFGMWVDPRRRGTGVGRALVDAVVAQARAAGRRRVVLDVVSDNAPATGLYERAGFVPTGRTSPYPHDEAVHEVEMELVLGDGPGSPHCP